MGWLRSLSDGAQEAIRWTKQALNGWYFDHGSLFDSALALEFIGFGGPDILEDVRPAEADELQRERGVEQRAVVEVPAVERLLGPADGLLGAVAELRSHPARGLEQQLRLHGQ